MSRAVQCHMHSGLDMSRDTVAYLSSFTKAERDRRGTCVGTWAPGCFRQAVLVIRWFLDSTRVRQLARDNSLSGPTCYRYLHEGTAALSAQAPTLEQAVQCRRRSAACT
ncbi:hypothetical protein [Streptomyces sp. 2A115]|uniref:hypothetical protein n=1 Tax=Streptomyces sp. 2A115 TaxID=3457439 RepID=UPI003FD5C005